MKPYVPGFRVGGAGVKEERQQRTILDVRAADIGWPGFPSGSQTRLRPHPQEGADVRIEGPVQGVAPVAGSFAEFARWCVPVGEIRLRLEQGFGLELAAGSRGRQRGTK